MKKKFWAKMESSGLPRGMQKKAYIFCAIMCIPAIYGIIKWIITNGYSVLLAFSLDTPFESKWTLLHFERFLIDMKTDGTLAIALANTMKYYAMSLFKTFISFVIAYFLYKQIPAYRLFRFLYFLPCVIAPIISVAIFKNMIRELGPVWTLMNECFGVTYSEPLAYPETATNAILLYQLLSGFGSTYLIYIGAMNRIPTEVLESASLDGCSLMREFWQIIFPLTWGTFSTFVLLSATMIFSASGPILYFTEGAAKTTTLGYWLFAQVRGGTYNYPSAVGVIFTLLTIPIVVCVRMLSKKINAEVTY